MMRIYQTIIVALALLFSAHSAQAATMPTVDPTDNFGLLSSGGPYSKETEIPQCSGNSNDTCTGPIRVVWFQFELDAAADVSLDTNESQGSDTILALYETDTDGTLLGQNDDCNPAASNSLSSCLSFSNLALGTYLVGVTSFNIVGIADPFADGWMLSGDNKNVVAYAGLNITISAVPVPAAVWLFGTALIGFVGMARRTAVKA